MIGEHVTVVTLLQRCTKHADCIGMQARRHWSKLANMGGPYPAKVEHYFCSLPLQAMLKAQFIKLEQKHKLLVVIADYCV